MLWPLASGRLLWVSFVAGASGPMLSFCTVPDTLPAVRGP